MQKVDGVSVENQLSDGSQLFSITEDGEAIKVGLIVVDTRVGRLITHKESGVKYTLGFVMEYPSGDSFTAVGLDGAEGIVAPAEAFTFAQ